MTDATTTPAKGTGLAFAYVTTLFFAWGFATSLIDPLVAAVRGVFELSFTEALLTQFAWFTAYGVFALPAAFVLARLGYARSIVGALGVMVLGALIVPLSTILDFYPGVLIALFVIGGGVTLLQVAANPLAASLGSEKGSHFRLVLSQAFNSLGTVVGPLLGATVMLSGGIFVAGGVTALGSFSALILLGLGVVFGLVAGALLGGLRRDLKGWIPLGAAIGLAVGWLIFLQNYIGGLAPSLSPAAPVEAATPVLDPTLRAQTLANIDTVFIGLAIFFALLGGFIWLIRSKLSTSASTEKGASPFEALKSKWAIFGAIGIFIYVGSEVAIGSLMTNFLEARSILSLSPADAGRLVALYWAGALMGRFAGSALLTRIPAAPLLAVFTTVAAVLCLVVTQTGGATAAFAALAVGLFNSIMFPAIFTLTLERSTAPASATSGLLVFGIIGGAVLPLVAGRVADMAGTINPAFFVPLAGYVLLVVFAVAASRAPVHAIGAAPKTGGH
ncbi:glucose/galactose MFS transporter [Brevundimonas sp. NIBR11]|uniref:glucose/galactose MFS transporter n=1 Tax=Brevundimonas sp. NIBR11 TaxID=3015999 RepID=UPI0022F1278A|nr:glucose/galactose MFS transporter [Brevundimonas sp. NIBR11]WGM31985.1 L-fucose-proton symporter [Brevundimonas sp. NIBR11]